MHHYSMFRNHNMSARNAFAVAAVLTVVMVAIAGFLLRARLAYDDYRNAPACTGPVSATCRGRIPATVTQVIITDATKYSASEYALRLNGPPPADGLVYFTSDNDVLDTAGPGDLVQTEIWRGEVTKVDLNGTVAGSNHLPSSVEAVELTCTLGAGGLASVFFVYGLGRRTDRLHMRWFRATHIAVIVAALDFAVAAYILLTRGGAVTYAYVLPLAVLGSCGFIGGLIWTVQRLTRARGTRTLRAKRRRGVARWQTVAGIAAVAAALGTTVWWLEDARQTAVYHATPDCSSTQIGPCRYTTQAKVIATKAVDGGNSAYWIDLSGNPPADGIIDFDSDTVPRSVRAGDTVQAQVWHGTVIRVTTASATDATRANPVNKTSAPLFLTAVTALLAFGFLRWPAHTRRREMTIARLVHPELVTMLCFGLGLTLMGFNAIWGALALFTGLAVLVLATVRPSVRLER
jgi:hypothetical protein